MRILKRSSAATPLLCIVLAACTVAGQGLTFSGSMISDLMLLHNYRAEAGDEADFSGTGRLSLTFRNTNRRYGKVEGDLEVVTLYGVAAEAAAPESPAGFGALAANGAARLFSLGNAPVLLDLRRLYLEFYLPFADIAVGRQIVNFGKGFVFSPIDVFTAVDVFDLDLRRRGSDVATVRVPFGALSGLDATVELPVAGNRFSAAAKVFATLGAYDVSLVGIYRHPGEDQMAGREGVIGATFKGDAVVGLYGELVTRLVEGQRDIYPEAMIGVDYSIRNRWILRAEYLYSDYRWNERAWGEHNAFVSVQYIANDLLSLSANLLYDFEHDIALGTALARYNALQNVNLEAYVRGFSGITQLPYDFAYGVRAEVSF
ncbi:MAG: hypothetical protein GF331_18495 [Chitinivibrionales bacterium]|nr:hypothetical protein [Chitinivibrionales bacterium]